MEAALDLARSHGTGFVGVRHSNHFGPAAYYVEKAVDAGLHRRGDFERAAEHGAVRRQDPLPRHESRRDRHTRGRAKHPLIFDASTSVVARGKIIVAAHTEKPIPEGWAIDPDGYPDH